MRWCCFDAPSVTEKDRPNSQQDLRRLSSSENITVFSYGELRAATNNFHPCNKLGQGGFGTVYKGTLKNGAPVATKVLSAESKQGVHEFLTEIKILTNVKHPNLVELIGCCIQGSTRILVYEYLENNSLDRALRGSDGEIGKLNWSMRSSICMGTARGLAFLHEELEPQIVHRDIKASNILLDRNFTPKIGDFGLARLFPDDTTHISTCVAGTTFGMLALEIVSGRSISKANWSEQEKFLLEWAWQLYEEGNLIELVDPNLKEYLEEEVLRYIKVALFCTQAATKQRPTMPQVVEMLSKQVRLNEKELTPPRLVQDLRHTSGGWKAGESTNVPPPSSATVTYSELVPR
ncbi:cold-responsive protein kinase 1-like isoform X2 [Phoenix dactylifera]|uniref:non-specific serine/threonine protein kinase n=1 Tax=Phoenix dactylifera TaxID=42345 RepID=A0A8B8ZZA9_PHODC|nr:cold-responsive protein kinase 1-like isoform X2 [Phoenix dactylifera]XP_038979651.1 cold-responsive protein kinase 1-like isoform X2 [Phoenix dactylifera]